jgi:hypothetical protein
VIKWQPVENWAGEQSYVEGALRLLRFVEARRPTGRRFGADADARWSDFKGDLDTVDRIELLLRDADAEWPGAFGARTVYALRAIAEDEPFGPAWQGIDPIDAEDLWRRIKSETSPASPSEALRDMASAWGIRLSSIDAGAIAPTDRLVLAGPSAIAAAIAEFSRGADLDWAEQVITVATPAAHRQLAAAAGALLNLNRPTRLLTASEASAVAPTRGARLLASADAESADRAAAQRIAGD